jgi:Ca2+-binding EF-hand superfamily protein
MFVRGDSVTLLGTGGRMTTFSESDIREAFQTFDRDGNGFIGTAHVAATAFSSPSMLSFVVWAVSVP